MEIYKSIVLKLSAVISCFMICFLISYECSAPPRALITLGESKDTGRDTYANQQSTNRTDGRNNNLDARRSQDNVRKRNEVSIFEQPFEIGNKSIIDRETHYKWEPFFDNPTSMLRFLMGDQDYNKRVPRFDELILFFDKVSSELRTHSSGELARQSWLQMDGNYISSTEVFSPDNKRFYRGLYWNSASRSYESVNIAPGDLANIILITQ